MAGKMQMLGFLAAAVCTLACGGCKDKARERALVEAEEARTELNKVRGELARSKREVADLREELAAAKETRDELHLKVEQFVKERTGAAVAAEQTQETVRALTARSAEQTQSVELLQKEVKQLRALVAEQQATIAELQKTPQMPAGTAAGGEGAGAQQSDGEPNQSTKKDEGSESKRTFHN